MLIAYLTHRMSSAMLKDFFLILYIPLPNFKWSYKTLLFMLRTLTTIEDEVRRYLTKIRINITCDMIRF